MSHPDIAKIRQLPPPIKMYALNGLAMAYANEIEDTMFWCFMAASKLGWEEAADLFYKGVRFAPKQDMTNAAVREKIDGTEHVLVWRSLVDRIQKHLGEGNNLRNLIGHNPITVSLYVSDVRGAPITVKVVQELRQKRAMVARRSRPPMTLRAEEMLAYCEALTSLYLDLEGFADEVLQFGAAHPGRSELRDLE